MPARCKQAAGRPHNWWCCAAPLPAAPGAAPHAAAAHACCAAWASSRRILYICTDRPLSASFSAGHRNHKGPCQCPCPAPPLVAAAAPVPAAVAAAATAPCQRGRRRRFRAVAVVAAPSPAGLPAPAKQKQRSGVSGLVARRLDGRRRLHLTGPPKRSCPILDTCLLQQKLCPGHRNALLCGKGEKLRGARAEEGGRRAPALFRLVSAAVVSPVHQPVAIENSF